MSIPKKYLIFLFISSIGFASENQSPMHWSGNKTVWDRANKKVELIGNAAVHQLGETITADHILFDQELRTLDAKGNCVYITKEIIIYSDEMHFNLDTRTGTILGGRVAGDLFSLTGERINKLGPGRFQTHRGEYTTCRDCAQSWSFQGGDVDMEFDGYAYMTDVTAKIKDVPVFWMPYLILPVKSRRQTGFLFPRFRIANEGVRFIQPFFWAINRSADLTLSFGYWGGQGIRSEMEGRYKLSDRSEGSAKLFYLKDKTFLQYLQEKNANEGKNYRETPHRFAFQLEQKQELPWHIDQKLRFVEVSDNLYPFRVGDVSSLGGTVLSSDLILSHTTNQVSTYVAAHRYRNLLFADPQGFDSKTVQVYPTFLVTTNDRIFFNSTIASGVSLGLTNFTRTGGDFDRDPLAAPVNLSGPDLGKDPIRRATRISITPSLYSSLRPFDSFSIVPSLEYRSFFYSFHNAIPNLSRGYLFFKTDFSTQIERVFNTSDPDIPKVKHLIRPFLTFNLIPLVHEPPLSAGVVGARHPFLEQIDYAKDKGFSGYHFDSNDIVPIDTSRTYNDYFIPLGKSLSYGFTTQLIRRRGKLESSASSYDRFVEWSAGQTLNLREFDHYSPEERQPFSQLTSSLKLNFDAWNSTVDYAYYPYGKISEKENRQSVSTSFSYILERATHQQILAFDRSVNLNYAYKMYGSPTNNLSVGLNYSLSDYVLPAVGFSYTFLEPAKWLSFNAGVKFQSPSRCWMFEVRYSGAVCDPVRPGDPAFCTTFEPNLMLNLVGSGFGTVSEAASSVLQQ